MLAAADKLSSSKSVSVEKQARRFGRTMIGLRTAGVDSRYAKHLPVAGKRRAERILGLSALPEMRLTVSFRITYTLRPVWGAGAASGVCLLFSFHRNLATVIIQRLFAAPLTPLKHQGGIERGLLS